MKLHYLKYFALLFIGVAVIACKKDDSGTLTIFPVTVYPITVVSKANVRMFVGGFEITDQAKITKFTTSLQSTTAFQDSALRSASNFIFTSTDSIKLPTNIYNIKKNSNKYLISYSYASTSVPVLSLPFTTLDVEKFFLYPQVAVTSNGGYQTTVTIPAYGDYSIFKIPIIQFKYSRNASSNTGLISGGTYNEFDASTINKLASTDTLAIHEFYINYFK